MTGASSGIGAAFVSLLAEAAVPVVAVARRTDRLAALALRHPGIEVLAADLHDVADRARVAARIAAPELPIDLVINNAGFGAGGRFVDVPLDEQLAEIDLNVSALVALSHAALQAATARGRGWLLNVSSVAGFVPAPDAAVYAATKAFVTSFSDALAQEAALSGVVVTALCPGLTRSEFHERATRHSGRPGLGSIAPSWAWMTSEQVARAGLVAVAKGRAVVVPGALNRVLVGGARLLPGPVRRAAANAARRR